MSMEFDNLYDPNTNDFQGQTPPLDVVLQQFFKVMTLELHTCTPALVTEVKNSCYVTVQPLLKTKFTNKTDPEAMPPIQMVPVVYPSGDDYWIKLPVQAGDVGILVFSERSLDSWKAFQNDSLVNPDDARSHHLSDAFFIPGVRRLNQPIAGDPNDMILHNSEAEIYLQKDGKFLIKNEDDELLELLSSLADAVGAIGSAVATLAPFVAGIPGLSPVDIAQILAAGSSASSAAGDADTIKGSIEDMTGSV